MRVLVLVVLLFLFIYNIPFSFLPIATGKIVLILSLFFLAFSVKGKLFSTLYLSPKVSGPFGIMIILAIYSLFINIFHNTRDYAVLYTYVIFWIEYFLGTFLLLYLIDRIAREKQEEAETVFFNAFVTIAVIQSILVYFMLFSPSFKAFSFSILRLDGVEDLNARYGGFRGLGYASSLTYDFAVLQSLALILIPYQVLHEKRVKIILRYLFAYFLIVGSVLISGRTGLFGIAISIFLFFYFSVSIRGNLFRLKANFSKFWLLYTCLSLLLIIYYSFFLNLSVRYYIEEVIVPYAFEAFINYLDSGTLETSSTNTLQQMYFPIDFNTFFWGDGYYRDPSGVGFYMGTDAGYMRQILFYGIFGSALLYLFYFKLMTKVRKINIKRELKTVFLSVIIYLFVVHYKGDILMGGSFVIKFVVLFYLTIQLNNIIGENRKKNISSHSY